MSTELGHDPFAAVPETAVIAVAMSGGVDSSVAAARCVSAGRQVIGITLAMWPGDRLQERDRGCCSIDAVDDARRVADRLGIAHYTWNLEDDFHESVIADFEAEYAAGRTPNPCVRCNERIKFGTLLARARAAGARHLATGHWARLDREGTAPPVLRRAADLRKDQSYTLHRLGPEQLAAAVFPLGAVPSKADLRREAEVLGLRTAAKPESQELCFVEGDLRADLERRLAGRFTPGEILDEEGRAVGRHRGLPFYTVGQRTGLGLAPARPDAVPLHVLDLVPASNAVVVGPRARLERRSITAADCRWTSGEPPRPGDACLVQLRAHGAAHPATVISAGPGATQVICDPPVLQVAPGQSLVLYDGDAVLGGGVVQTAA